MKAIDNLEASANIANKPAVSKAVFRKLLPEFKAAAFTITGVADHDVIQACRDAIATLPLGGDWDEIKKDLETRLSPYLNPIAAEKRAELLLRLHGFMGYGLANVRKLDAMKDVFPYRQYQSSQDGRVRDSHAALNKITLPAEHPFWAKHTPPWEYNCRCDVVGLTQEDVEDMQKEEEKLEPGRKYLLEGEVLRKFEQDKILVRDYDATKPRKGQGKGHFEYDMRTASEKPEEGGGFEWEPATLGLSMDMLKARYDAPVWAKFESWAKKTNVTGETFTVWDWLAKTPRPAALPVPVPAPVAAPVAFNSAPVPAPLR